MGRCCKWLNHSASSSSCLPAVAAADELLPKSEALPPLLVPRLLPNWPPLLLPLVLPNIPPPGAQTDPYLILFAFSMCTVGLRQTIFSLNLHVS